MKLIKLSIFFLAMILTSVFTALQIQKKFPIPHKVVFQKTYSATPKDEELKEKIPLFFWRYSILLDRSKALQYELYIPYEKGPPANHIGRLIFIDSTNLENALTLHGPRPRKIDINQLYIVAQSGDMDFFARWKQRDFLIQLAKESGQLWYHHIMGQTDTLDQRSIYINQRVFEWKLDFSREPYPESNPEMGFGSSWGASQGRLAFLDRAGSIFQVECGQEKPCEFWTSLLNIRFLEPDQNTARFRELMEKEIKNQLSRMPQIKPEERTQAERRLMLVLASLLTIDPRDPQIYFHLGKLTKYKPMLESMIRYGQDLKMDQAQLFELKSLAK